MWIKIILAAVLCGVIGFAAAGFGAAAVLTSIFGDRDGGTSMGGFFSFGPIGGVAGVLLGVGLALRFAGGSSKWGFGFMVGAGVLAALGSLLFAYVSLPDHAPSYSYVIQFQLEYPSEKLAGIEVPGPHAMWGAAGGEADDRPISQFFDKKCDAGLCVIGGSVAAIGNLDKFRINSAISEASHRFVLGIPAVIAGPTEWSPWRVDGDARVRWRIQKL